jgi:hypothetical protein
LLLLPTNRNRNRISSAGTAEKINIIPYIFF